VPSQRESNAATQDGRAANDYHESEDEEGNDSAEDEDRKENRRQGSSEAARPMLRCVYEAPPAARTGNHAPFSTRKPVGMKIAPYMSPVTTTKTTVR
jgi:hypothetical protein